MLVRPKSLHKKNKSKQFLRTRHRFKPLHVNQHYFGRWLVYHATKTQRPDSRASRSYCQVSYRLGSLSTTGRVCIAKHAPIMKEQSLPHLAKSTLTNTVQTAPSRSRSISRELSFIGSIRRPKKLLIHIGRCRTAK